MDECHPLLHILTSMNCRLNSLFQFCNIFENRLYTLDLCISSILSLVSDKGIVIETIVDQHCEFVSQILFGGNEYKTRATTAF